MRVLFSQTAYPPSIGGAQLHQHMLARSMSSWHDVAALCQWDVNRTDWLLGTTIRAPGPSLNYTIDDIPVHRIGLSTIDKLKCAAFIPFYYILTAHCAPAIAGIIQPHVDNYVAWADVVHNTRIGREYLSLALLASARVHNKPFIFTPVHHPRWHGRRYETFVALYKAADAIIALTNAEKKILIELGVQEENIFVTGIGPVVLPKSLPQDFINKYRIDGPFVLFLGQHYPYKGYRAVLQSMACVWDRCPDAHFVFAGPAVGGSERYFEAYADKRLRRISFLSEQDKTNALDACSILCVPSMQESFGGVFTEAWNFKKPVIGGNIPAVSEVIQDGVDGFVVRQDSDVIAHRIVALLSDEALARSMGEAGRTKLDKKYSWEALSQKTGDAYKYALMRHA